MLAEQKGQCVTMTAATKQGQGREGREGRGTLVIPRIQILDIQLPKKCCARPVYVPREASQPTGNKRRPPAQHTFLAAFLRLNQPKQGLNFPMVMSLVSSKQYGERLKVALKRKECGS